MNEPQLVPMNDGDHDHAPQEERDNGDGVDRVSEDTLMHKFHRNNKLNLWLLQKLMRYQMRTFQT